MSTEKQYANRDPEAQGMHYITHVGAMTSEGLHSKSSIAAELAHRDIEISRLHAENEALQSGYDAARMEIASLQELLEYSKKANDAWAAKTHALEAKNIGLLHALTAEQDENHALHQQLAAIGAGGVEPLRKRDCLHKIDEQAQIYSDAQRDAQRYRWLRKQHWNEGVLCVVAQPKNALKLGFDCPSLDRLDGFIDSAIAAQGGV